MKTDELTNNRLYHISFDGDLEGIWVPRDPLVHEGVDTEPYLPRISCAPTIEQCFQAIYPNVSKYFEEKNYPYMLFYVYSPELDGDEEVLSSDKLINQHIVPDAHMTDEVCILSPVYMKKIMKIKILNTNNNTFLKYHPWDDPKRKMIDFAPDDISFNILSMFKKTTT